MLLWFLLFILLFIEMWVDGPAAAAVIFNSMQLFCEGEKMKNFILFFLFLLSTITIGASKRKPAEVDPQDYGKHMNSKTMYFKWNPIYCILYYNVCNV